MASPSASMPVETMDDQRRYTRNAVRCLACGGVVESVDVHDFRTCPCGSVSVDGGEVAP